MSIILAAFAAAAVALLAAEAAARLLRLLIRHGLGGDTSVSLKAPIVRRPIRLIRLTLFAVLFIALTPPALELAGAPLTRGLRLGQVTAWAFTGGLRLLLIAGIAFVLLRVISLLVGRFEQDVSAGSHLEVLERAKRARTLGGLIRNVLTVAVVIVASLMMLAEVGLNLTPILTGAGILGLAVGFGAQTLVKDIISGFFMILENEVRVGDIVTIGTHGGVVEEMSLRTLVLRDLEGTVHIIPNGSIEVISNRSKDFSYALLEVPAAYSANTDDIVAAVRDVGADLRADSVFAPFILADVEVLGVDAFADSSILIKARIKTMPMKQWEIAREFRRRLKKVYDARGIEFPFPTRTLNIAAPVPALFEEQRLGKLGVPAEPERAPGRDAP